MASFTVGGSASGTGTSYDATGTVARPAAVSRPPSSNQPTCPIPRHRKPSTAGATANAAPRPMSCRPTYSLCAWAGASSKLSANTAAAWHISPTEWTATAASKTAAEAHAGRPDDTATPPQAIRKTNPATRIAAAPWRTVLTFRPTQTCSATTPIVLTINTAPTIQRGAFVSVAIQSGRANVMTAYCRLITPLRTVYAMNSLSRRATPRRVPGGAGSGATCGSLAHTHAPIRKVAAFAR